MDTFRKLNVLAGSLMMILLSVAGIAAASDLRLVDAVKNKDQDAVRSLLQQHVDINAAEADGSTALDWAAHWNDLETAEQLLRSGANVNAANDYGVTPLSLACSNANAAMVRKLLDAGANANAAQWSGETALMTCARTGSVEAVKLLLDRKADVNAKTRRGQTALMWAAAEKHADVIQALIERGADVNAKSHMLEGFKPAAYITYGVGYKAPGKPDPIQPTDLHPDPASSKGGFTALMFAAQKGDLDSVRLLLAGGANVNESSPDYGNALLMAAASGHESLSIFLLDKGADPNVTDSFGFTPLHYALREGIKAINMHRNPMPSDTRWLLPNMPSLVKALLAHGANPNARVVKGYPPFDVPAFGRSTGNSMPHLKQPGATPFFLAAAAQDPSLMRLLATSGADPKLATQEGTTPLMVAAGLGRVEDLTPEQEKQALEAVQLAMELGGDINAVNQDGQTALHAAAYLGANSIIQFLVEKGAKLNPPDKYGQTPLDIASGDPRHLVEGDKRFAVGRREHKTAAELLVKLGAAPLPAAVPRVSQATGPGIPQ
jgi:ankyrin repeat protein